MSKKIKLSVLLIFLIISSAILIYYTGWSIAPGSYPRAEIYEFEVSESELIEIVNLTKESSPELQLESSRFIDGRRNHKDLWHHVYFYYPDTDEVVKTWIRNLSDNKTSFAYASQRKLKGDNKWILANEDFWWWKNNPRKEKFEKLILSKIKTQVLNRE